ncbi:hypothetical protein Droror1_Dr00021998 [Drosera rotundifolia]
MSQPSYFNTILMFLTFTIAVILASCSMLQARPFESKLGVQARPFGLGQSLEARLKVDDEESTDCWGSLFELQACTGEVIQFFYNGETQLGANCCRAIHVIEHNCWPAMMSSLGFSTEESAILRGYCDAEEDEGDTSSPPPVAGLD